VPDVVKIVRDPGVRLFYRIDLAAWSSCWRHQRPACANCQLTYVRRDPATTGRIPSNTWRPRKILVAREIHQITKHAAALRDTKIERVPDVRALLRRHRIGFCFVREEQNGASWKTAVEGLMNNGRAGHHTRGGPSRRRLRVAAIRQKLTNRFFRIPGEFTCDKIEILR
jgi:hypothetical protein